MGQHQDYKPGYLTQVPDIVFHGNFAMKVCVRAMLHWIKKGDANKAAQRAREAAHYGNIILTRGWRQP